MFATPAFAQATGGGAAGAFGSFIPLILIFAIMYFLLIRPQQKKMRSIGPWSHRCAAGMRSSPKAG